MINLIAFVLPIEQNWSRVDPVKTEYDSCQGTALAESDEEAVETLLHRSFADGNKAISGFFCGSVRRTNPQKPKGMKQAARQAASVRIAGARGQGECNPHWQS